MQLTGKEIIKKEIISNFCQEGIQQQGVDLRVKKINVVKKFDDVSEEIAYIPGYIPKTGKSKIPVADKEAPVSCDTYILKPGYYEVEFEEGCKVPSNMSLHIKTRSSLVRCGSICHSGQFDAGFETENMGCFLHVILPIYIEKGARIAQAILFESDDVENLYDGQWQNDKQRKKNESNS